MSDSVGLGPQQTPDFNIQTSAPLVETPPTQDKPTISPQIIQDGQEDLSGLQKTGITYTAPIQSPKLEKPSTSLDQSGQTSKTSETGTVSSTNTTAPPKTVFEFADSSTKIAKETLEKQQALIMKMPDGPEKVRYMDFLTKVATALAELQKLIQEMQTGDSKDAGQKSKAQLQVTLNKIKAQLKAQDDINKKQTEADKKSASSDSTSKALQIIGVISAILVVVVLGPILMATPPLGWLALGLLICSIVDMCAKLDNTPPPAMAAVAVAIDKMAEAWVDASAEMSIPAPTAEEKERNKIIFKMLLTVSIMAAATAGSFGAFFVGGAGPLTELLASTKVITEAVKKSGGSDKMAADAEMYTGIAITAAFVLASMAGGGVMAWKSAASSALSGGQKFLQIAQTIVDVSVTLTSTGLSITSDVMKIEMEKLLIQIIKLQAEMDSGGEVRDEVIALLKKMVQKLLESLEGMGQQISSISQLIKKVYDDASQTTTELYG